MLFSCADWESQCPCAPETCTLNQLPLKNRRKVKAISKFGVTPEQKPLTSEFDVDLVMKKVASLNQTERVTSAKRYLKNQPVTSFFQQSRPTTLSF